MAMTKRVYDQEKVESIAEREALRAEHNALVAVRSLMEYHHKKCLDQLNAKIDGIEVTIKYGVKPKKKAVDTPDMHW